VTRGKAVSVRSSKILGKIKKKKKPEKEVFLFQTNLSANWEGPDFSLLVMVFVMYYRVHYLLFLSSSFYGVL